MAQQTEGSLLALIVDQDTATGLLLTGVGHSDLRKRTNYLIVDESEFAGHGAGPVVE
jgi:V-type H+-transporting ATPase subunit F